MLLCSCFLSRMPNNLCIFNQIGIVPSMNVWGRGGGSKADSTLVEYQAKVNCNRVVKFLRKSSILILYLGSIQF